MLAPYNRVNVYDPRYNGSLLSLVDGHALMAAEVLRHDQTLACKPRSRPLENYAVRFDELFGTRAQRQGLRRYFEGLLLPAERNKTLTALANTEPQYRTPSGSAAQGSAEPAMVPFGIEAGSDEGQRTEVGVAA